jgi:cytochrome bd-type quinol oxidase subunit 2
MAEIENAVENQTKNDSEKSVKGNNFFAAVKERCRKFIVNLKRRPMNIAFFVLIISSIVYLCSLGNLSQTALNVYVDWLGLSVFVDTLFCILALLLFMNSFPKREKKPKLVALILLFVFIAAMIVFDIIFYVNVYPAYSSADAATKLKLDAYVPSALASTIAHIVLVAIAAILTATYPLYGKLINMINTRKVIEDSNLKTEVDRSEEV